MSGLLPPDKVINGGLLPQCQPTWCCDKNVFYTIAVSEERERHIINEVISCSVGAFEQILLEIFYIFKMKDKMNFCHEKGLFCNLAALPLTIAKIVQMLCKRISDSDAEVCWGWYPIQKYFYTEQPIAILMHCYHLCQFVRFNSLLKGNLCPNIYSVIKGKFELHLHTYFVCIPQVIDLQEIDLRGRWMKRLGTCLVVITSSMLECGSCCPVA